MQQCFTKWEIYIEDRPVESPRVIMCPLVQKGATGVIYVPWAQVEKDGLRANLP